MVRRIGVSNYYYYYFFFWGNIVNCVCEQLKNINQLGWVDPTLTQNKPSIWPKPDLSIHQTLPRSFKSSGSGLCSTTNICLWKIILWVNFMNSTVCMDSTWVSHVNREISWDARMSSWLRYPSSTQSHKSKFKEKPTHF